MPDYGMSFQLAAVSSTGYKTAGAVLSNGTRRLKVFDFSVGHGTPNATDSAVQWDISRIIAATTTGATSAPCSPLDAADAAAASTGLSNYSAEPTYAAGSTGLSIWNDSINQRAAYRWVAKDGKEIVVPAVTSAALGLRAQCLTASAYASIAGGSLFFNE